MNKTFEIEMVQIPSGQFWMGSPETEPDRREDEGPQHEVTVPSFCLCPHPVTQSQWRVVASWGKVKKDLDPDPSNFKGASRPVDRVSWDDAVEFCARLAAHTGHPYRLPTEAEWEYACRAGTTTPFYFGDTLSPEVANYDCSETYGPQGVKGEQIGQTTPVDSYHLTSAFGLSDMHGNVWEWCQDDWHDNYDGAPEDSSAWLNKNDSTLKVLRGGSWINHPGDCRSAYRLRYSRVSRNSIFGFRVACHYRSGLP